MSDHSTPPRRVPDWLLERMAVGELPPERLRQVRQQLEMEPGGLERLRALDASSAEILRAHPPATVLAEVRRRAATKNEPPARDWLRNLFTVGLPVAAAAAVVVAIGLNAVSTESGDSSRDTAIEHTRRKGLQPLLLLHRQRGTAVEQLAEGSQAEAGDLLQLHVAAVRARHIVVLSIDGRGIVTRHLPEHGDEAIAATDVDELALPSSYELDDAPGFERFFLVSSEQSFFVGPVVQAARDLALRGDDARHGALELEPSLSQSSVLVIKASP